jgi:hypothetical protein
MTACQNGYWKIRTNGIGCCGAGMALRQLSAFNVLYKKMNHVHLFSSWRGM